MRGMEECEICGTITNEVFNVINEGRRGKACLSCIKKYNLIIIRSKGMNVPTKRRYMKLESKSPARMSKGSIREILKINDEYDLIDNYGEIIKTKREELGLTQNDLARELKIKVSYVKKIEAGIIPPSYELARDIERLLGIKIIIKRMDEKEEIVTPSNNKNIGFTIGDFMGMRNENEGD